jgi:hypothetical protein
VEEGDPAYPIRYWDGTNRRFTLSDDGVVYVRGLEIENDADHVALTIRSTDPSNTAVELFNDDDAQVGFINLFQFAGFPRSAMSLGSSQAKMTASFSLVTSPGGGTDYGQANMEVGTDGSWFYEVTDTAKGSVKLSTTDGVAESAVLRFSGITAFDPDDSETGFVAEFEEREDGGDPESPASGFVRLYAKTSSGVARLFTKDSAGAVHGPY